LAAARDSGGETKNGRSAGPPNGRTPRPKAQQPTPRGERPCPATNSDESNTKDGNREPKAAAILTTPPDAAKAEDNRDGQQQQRQQNDDGDGGKQDNEQNQDNPNDERESHNNTPYFTRTDTDPPADGPRDSGTGQKTTANWYPCER